MVNKTWYVYMHTNTINNKKYIGITSNTPSRRWRKDGYGYRKQPFGNAIKKYGWDAFNHDILYSGLTKEDALEKEMSLIKQYNTCDPLYGYNITEGGDVSDSCMLNAKRIYQYSLDGSYITCFNSISEAERIHGKGISSCINNKSKTSNGYQWFDEYKGEKIFGELSREEAISYSQFKEVFQYSLNGEFIKRYNSIKEASEETGYERSGISSCIIGRQKTFHDYRWFENYLGEHIESVVSYNHKSKEIYQYTLDGEYIRKYESVRKASKEIGKSIHMYNRNIKKSCGYIWSFELMDTKMILEGAT